MNETVVTLIGNVATDVRSTTSQTGVPITSFRIASTTRRFERGKGWADLDTIYVTVVCWRALAENVASSMAKGDPVVVSGRLRMRQWVADDGRAGTSVELEATAAGHDLSRGVTQFTRVRPRETERPGRTEADELAAMVSREPLSPSPAGDPDAARPAAETGAAEAVTASTGCAEDLGGAGPAVPVPPGGGRRTPTRPRGSAAAGAAA